MNISKQQQQRPDRQSATKTNAWAFALSLALLGSSFLTPQSLHAQTKVQPAANKPKARPQIFTEVLNVDIVNVDVYVTDKEGNPVSGLTKDDFELRVEGRPIKITNFYAVEGGSRTDMDEDEIAMIQKEVASRLPIDASPIEIRRAAIPPDQRLHVVIYIDNFNLSPFKRNKVMRELRQFLRTELEPTDEVMLVSYDRSIHMREPFTFRPDTVSRALLGLEDKSAQGIHRTNERIDVMKRIEEAESVTDAYSIAQSYAGSYRNDVSFTLDALRSVIDGLAGSSGRKALVYVSEGLPLIVGEDMFQQIQLMFKEGFSMNYAMEYDMSGRFQELANQANANRVSFYTVDARGLTVLTQGTVDQEIKGQAGERTLIDHVNNTNLQSTIQLLAERTGGRATINANKFLPAFKSMAADFRNYYSLGFPGTDTSDGRYHRFGVRLKQKRKGWTLRHRDGYRSKSIESMMHDYTLSALNLNLQENPLKAQIIVGRQGRRTDGLFDVELALVIPRDEITFLPVEGHHYAKIRLWMAAKDTNDEMSPMRQIPLEFNLTDDEYKKVGEQGLPYLLKLEMEEGYTDLAMGIRDELGARLSYIRQGISVGRGR